MSKFHAFLKDTALMASAGGIGCLTGNPIGLAVIAISPIYGGVMYYADKHVDDVCDEFSDLLERYDNATDVDAFIDSLSEKKAKRIVQYIQYLSENKQNER